MKLHISSYFIFVLIFLFFFVSCNGNEKNRTENSVHKDTIDYEINSDDDSRISSDGPYVFYEDDKIIVRQIEMYDGEHIITEKIYDLNDEIILTCNVDTTYEKFSFKLRKSFPVQQSIYKMPERILAVSDIEGNFYAFKKILRGAGVIDNNLNWVFGNGHLVCNGDFFDRGINVTEVLWLIYKLEEEAEKAGGKVHFIIGNHEQMNLRGSHKYVRNKYVEISDSLKISYSDLYGKNTELGKWLRTKNLIEKIGDLVFLHAGISPELAAMNLPIYKINNIIRDDIDTDKNELKNKDTLTQYIFGKEGPLWYRGLVKQEISEKEVEKLLNYLGAKKIILGHTIVKKITYFYAKKVIGIDLIHPQNYMQGLVKALFIEKDKFYVIDEFGNKSELK